MVIAAAVLIGLSVLLVGGVLASGRSEPTGVARSLALIDMAPGQSHLSRSELPAKQRLVDPLFDRFAGLGRALSPEGATARLAVMLDKAGNPAAWTPERILGTKGLALVLGALVGLAWGGLSLRGLVATPLLGAFGFYIPDLLLKNAALRRQEQVRKGLAEALDMLTVCVEAGQGFDAALGQVARKVTGPIAGEFARALSEIQIGKTRGEAFAGLGERVDSPEVKSFVTALVQADRLGLPIAQVLREQTATMRLARRQRAEEKAQKVTVKILFPLIFCILPAIFVVLLGPGVIRIIQTFRDIL
jgi:tight adherence protein C